MKTAVHGTIFIATHIMEQRLGKKAKPPFNKQQLNFEHYNMCRRCGQVRTRQCLHIVCVCHLFSFLVS